MTHSHSNPERSENTLITQTIPICQIPSSNLTFLSPQYTLNQSDPNPETHNFVEEHVLIPTLHYSSYYNYTNPLTLPLLNTAQNIERNKNELFRLTTALTPRQFTYIGNKSY